MQRCFTWPSGAAHGGTTWGVDVLWGGSWFEFVCVCMCAMVNVVVSETSAVVTISVSTEAGIFD
ncbi:hypothetical protein E2C01_074007 [Portunus trituberculatus]|uniref:Uncharacterized protein n=1 Tax=Portunus trituberculatus TaxID=210409 RepID=A0A5B7IF72_PORTR|nr:hypothetical protein [Portunus trituberculatus]